MYQPQETLTPYEIASPKGPAQVNHPIPTGVRVERQPAGAVYSANPSGNYVSPADIARDGSQIKK